jgi:hypothetical protein
MRAALKRSPPLPRWLRNLAAQSSSEIGRNVAPRSAALNVSDSLAPDPGTVDRPRPRMTARAAVASPRVAGATVVTGSTSSTIATSRKLSPLAWRQPGCIANRAVWWVSPATATNASSLAPSERCATQCAAVTTRFGATSVPPHAPTSANQGTVSGATGSPPITAPAGAAPAHAPRTATTATVRLM